MGTNNVKALKQLDVSEKTPIFRFRDQETAAVILLISLNAHVTFPLHIK